MWAKDEQTQINKIEADDDIDELIKMGVRYLLFVCMMMTSFFSVYKQDFCVINHIHHRTKVCIISGTSRRGGVHKTHAAQSHKQGYRQSQSHTQTRVASF